MECKIREWKMEDAAELAATLNNKISKTTFGMACLILILRMMLNSISMKC